MIFEEEKGVKKGREKKEVKLQRKEKGKK